MVEPRTLAAVALLGLVPVLGYTLGVDGNPTYAVTGTLCVLVVAGSLYALFGGVTDGAEADASHGSTETHGNG